LIHLARGECAFCTFPDKAAATAEFARVVNAASRAANGELLAGRRLNLPWSSSRARR
jgi:hypothetical protein